MSKSRTGNPSLDRIARMRSKMLKSAMELEEAKTAAKEAKDQYELAVERLGVCIDEEINGQGRLPGMGVEDDEPRQDEQDSIPGPSEDGVDRLDDLAATIDPGASQGPSDEHDCVQPAEWRAVPVTELGLTKGIEAKLIEAEIFTLGHLSDWHKSGKDITKIPKIGKTGAARIEEAVDAYFAAHPEMIDDTPEIDPEDVIDPDTIPIPGWDDEGVDPDHEEAVG